MTEKLPDMPWQRPLGMQPHWLRSIRVPSRKSPRLEEDARKNGDKR